VTIVAHDVGSVGGMERQLAELALGLRGLGHDVTVIARKCVLPEGSGVRVRIVRVPRRPFLLYYLWFLVTGSLAVARYRRGVVQATGAIVLNRVDAISVHALHQIYSAAPPPRGSRLADAHVRLTAAVKRAVERACFRINAQATFVCVSNGVADEVREHVAVDPAHVVTIHNGVDTAAFAPGLRRREAQTLREGLEIDPPTLVLAFVGGNWEDKGLGLLIEALAGAPGWELVVAGAGEPRPYLDLARRLDVAGRVHWLGVVHDIETVYELADAFALPSRYETFSLVTFEAAASGVPVLATPVSGVSELIEDTRNGYLVAPDASQIAARLRELAGDPELRARLGAAARSAALGFSSAQMIRAHHELLTRLASSRPRRGAGV
jgi:glycosyltransferase involved in cell wall biosynthesis